MHNRTTWRDDGSAPCSSGPHVSLSLPVAPAAPPIQIPPRTPLSKHVRTWRLAFRNAMQRWSRTGVVACWCCGSGRVRASTWAHNNDTGRGRRWSLALLCFLLILVLVWLPLVFHEPLGVCAGSRTLVMTALQRFDDRRKLSDEQGGESGHSPPSVLRPLYLFLLNALGHMSVHTSAVLFLRWRRLINVHQWEAFMRKTAPRQDLGIRTPPGVAMTDAIQSSKHNRHREVAASAAVGSEAAADGSRDLHTHTHSGGSGPNTPRQQETDTGTDTDTDTAGRSEEYTSTPPEYELVFDARLGWTRHKVTTSVVSSDMDSSSSSSSFSSPIPPAASTASPTALPRIVPLVFIARTPDASGIQSISSLFSSTPSLLSPLVLSGDHPANISILQQRFLAARAEYVWLSAPMPSHICSACPPNSLVVPSGEELRGLASLLKRSGASGVSPQFVIQRVFPAPSALQRTSTRILRQVQQKLRDKQSTSVGKVPKGDTETEQERTRGAVAGAGTRTRTDAGTGPQAKTRTAPTIHHLQACTAEVNSRELQLAVSDRPLGKRRVPMDKDVVITVNMPTQEGSSRRHKTQAQPVQRQDATGASAGVDFRSTRGETEGKSHVIIPAHAWSSVKLVECRLCSAITPALLMSVKDFVALWTAAVPEGTSCAGPDGCAVDSMDSPSDVWGSGTWSLLDVVLRRAARQGDGVVGLARNIVSCPLVVPELVPLPIALIAASQDERVGVDAFARRHRLRSVRNSMGVVTWLGCSTARAHCIDYDSSPSSSLPPCCAALQEAHHANMHTLFRVLKVPHWLLPQTLLSVAATKQLHPGASGLALVGVRGTDVAEAALTGTCSTKHDGVEGTWCLRNELLQWGYTIATSAQGRVRLLSLRLPTSTSLAPKLPRGYLLGNHPLVTPVPALPIRPDATGSGQQELCTDYMVSSAARFRAAVGRRGERESTQQGAGLGLDRMVVPSHSFRPKPLFALKEERGTAEQRAGTALLLNLHVFGGEEERLGAELRCFVPQQDHAPRSGHAATHDSAWMLEHVLQSHELPTLSWMPACVFSVSSTESGIVGCCPSDACITTRHTSPTLCYSKGVPLSCPSFPAELLRDVYTREEPQPMDTGTGQERSAFEYALSQGLGDWLQLNRLQCQRATGVL